MTQTPPLVNLYPEELYKIKSKVLIVLSKPWSEVGDEEIILLGKILNAVKLSLAAVQIITRAEFTVEDFECYQPTCIIAFGSILKDSTKKYETLSIGGIPIVVADELLDLDDVRKKNLWLTLKQVFHS
jgi:hypothetical protein